MTAEVTPHHLVFTDDDLVHVRHEPEGEPAAPHGGGPRRAPRRRRRRHDRRDRHRPRAARGRGEGGGVRSVAARARSASRRRWPPCSRTSCGPGTCRLSRALEAMSVDAGPDPRRRPATAARSRPGARRTSWSSTRPRSGSSSRRSLEGAELARSWAASSPGGSAHTMLRGRSRRGREGRRGDAADRRAALLVARGRHRRSAGTAFGAEGETFGEAVFNTGMAGYQEVLTDPSYAGQIVAMTSPHQGNYGMNARRPGVGARPGRRVRRARGRRAAPRRGGRRRRWPGRRSRRRASSGSRGSTRAGSPVASASRARCGRRSRRVDLDPASLVDRVRADAGDGRRRPRADRHRPSSRTRPRALVGPAVDRPRPGLPRRRLRLRHEAQHPAAARGRAASRPPSSRPRRRRTTIAAGGFDGVFLSNGPGDPAATAYGIAAARDAARQGADLRDLPRPPAARARARRSHLQDAVRASRREPAREERRDRGRRDHEPQPRLRGRPRRLGARTRDGVAR